VRVEAQPAFVLHARPWRETSLLVELLTRDHGRVGVVARGLTGPKRHPLRAALQPLQAIRVDFLPRGELARLLQAEALDVAPAIAGEALMAAFYVNELVLRLTPRNDAAEAVFELYSRVRGELAGNGSLAWTLRRFERDLLDALGVGLPWDRTVDDVPVAADARYRLDPSEGPILDGRRRSDTVSGAALLALAGDEPPEPGLLSELRPALRAVLASHLGPAGLRSWGLLGELARVKPRDLPQEPSA
jgi:DNA repair protein RecO (recombination protein O)